VVEKEVGEVGGIFSGGKLCVWQCQMVIIDNGREPRRFLPNVGCLTGTFLVALRDDQSNLVPDLAVREVNDSQPTHHEGIIVHNSHPSSINAQDDMTVFPYFRYLLIILFSTYGVIYLLRFSLARPPPKEAVNNAKYIKGITQMAFLPEELKPSRAHDHGKRRLIFIGDVHGAYDELVSLLDKVKYKSSTGVSLRVRKCLILDHVVFLGDLVSKRPHSQKVVKLAMKLNASCVIGNHDYELLDWMGYIDSVGDSRLDTYINPEDLPKELVLGAEEHVLAMGFDSQAAGWMLQCPLILNVGSVHGEDVVAVHAGLLPGRPFEEQGYILFF